MSIIYKIAITLFLTDFRSKSLKIIEFFVLYGMAHIYLTK